MTTLTAKVTALSHADVRGKIQLYLKIEANGNDILINIGQKTYDALLELSTIRENHNKNQTTIEFEKPINTK